MSSLSFSDVSMLRASSSKRAAAVAERALKVLTAQRDDTDLEEFKRQKKNEVSDLRGQMQQLQHDKDMLAMKLDHLQRRYEAERQDLEERQLGPARARLSILETEAARARDGLESSKQHMVSALQLSRMEYDQLTAMPEAERSVGILIYIYVFV